MITLEEQIKKVRQWANYTEPDDSVILEAAAKSLESLRDTAKTMRKKAPTHPMYAKYIDAYNEFCKGKRIVARIDAANGKAMKEIIAYMEQYTEGDSQKAYNGWVVLLSRWEQLNDWLKTQTQLVSINKHLLEIITKLTHGTNTTQRNQQSANDLASRVRERRANTATTA